MTDSELSGRLLDYCTSMEMVGIRCNLSDIMREAADRIHTLSAERQKFLQEISKAHEVINSLLPKVCEWIPCSERLPESGTECNVVWVNRNPQPYYAEIKDVPGVAAAIYYKGKWYWRSSTCEDVLAEYGKNDFDKVDDCIEITHWMSLPEPPEEVR